MVPILSFFWNEITLPTKTLRHLASRLLADEIFAPRNTRFSTMARKCQTRDFYLIFRGDHYSLLKLHHFATPLHHNLSLVYFFLGVLFHFGEG